MSDLLYMKSVKQQAHYHQLRLVCRRFRNIFQQHLQLSRQVMLSCCFTHDSLLSFYSWLQRHETAVQSIKIFSHTQFLEPALKALKDLAPGLVNVQVRSCSPSAVVLLSFFTSMVVCQLQSRQCLDISDLQAAPSLRSLGLQGDNKLTSQFTALQLPRHLTELTLNAAKMHIAESCKCVTSLRVLTVSGGEIHGLHDQGLPACSKLQALSCWSDSLFTSKDSGCFSTIPNSVHFLSASELSALSCIRELSVDCTYTAWPEVVVDLNPLFALKGLESLWLQWDTYLGAEPLQVQSGIIALSRLSQIHLVSRFEVCLDVDWQLMCVLQSLTVNCRLRCDERMLDLSRLTTLRCLDITHCRACNGDSLSVLKRLVSSIHSNCPGVSMLYDKKGLAHDLRDVFDLYL